MNNRRYSIQKWTEIVLESERSLYYNENYPWCFPYYPTLLRPIGTKSSGALVLCRVNKALLRGSSSLRPVPTVVNTVDGIAPLRITQRHRSLPQPFLRKQRIQSSVPKHSPTRPLHSAQPHLPSVPLPIATHHPHTTADARQQRSTTYRHRTSVAMCAVSSVGAAGG